MVNSTLLQHDFEDWVLRDGGRPALICRDERYSYGDVASRAYGIGRALEQCGVRRGDRVALFLDNGVEFVAGMLATLTLGAVFMPINPSTKHDKLAYMLGDARAVVLLTEDSLEMTWGPAVAASPSVRSVFVAGDASVGGRGARAWPEPAETPATEPGLIDQDLAAIIYTSGSTGDPKGVMLTHLNMVSAARRSAPTSGCARTTSSSARCRWPSTTGSTRS